MTIHKVAQGRTGTVAPGPLDLLHSTQLRSNKVARDLLHSTDNYLDDFDDICNRLTNSTFSTSPRVSNLCAMRADLETARDRLDKHRRNNAKRAYYNRCIQLLETFKYDRVHPFDNDYIDRLPKFLERKYSKYF